MPIIYKNNVWALQTRMVAKKKTLCEMGQAVGFSDNDIRRLNTYYKCKGFKQVGSEPETDKDKPRVKPACVDDKRWVMEIKDVMNNFDI